MPELRGSIDSDFGQFTVSASRTIDHQLARDLSRLVEPFIRRDFLSNITKIVMKESWEYRVKNPMM